jgi:hypothetical protein
MLFAVDPNSGVPRAGMKPHLRQEMLGISSHFLLL